MQVDLNQISAFFRAMYSDPEWLGVLYIEVMELYVDGEGKRKARMKVRREIRCLDDVDALDSAEGRAALQIYSNQGYHIFYTCAFTDNSPQRTKENTLGVPALWADVDDVDEDEMKARLRDIPLPPTGVVATGGGYHIYWKLDKYYEYDDTIEVALRRVRDWVKAPKGTTDVTRLLRVPGTWNSKPWKYKEPRPCRIESWLGSAKYNLREFLQANMSLAEVRLPEDFKEKYIKRGEFIGDQADRSARDFAVVKELLNAGHSDKEIIDIFKNPEFGVSSKAIERGPEYIELTIKKAKQEVGNGSKAAVYDDALVVYRKRVSTQGLVTVEPISNFCLVPLKRILLVDEGTELVEAELKYNGRTRILQLGSVDLISWRGLVKRAEVPGIAWKGTDTEWSSYVCYLFDKIMVEEKASTVIGWSGKSFVMADETWFSDEIKYVKTPGKAVPHFIFRDDKAGFAPHRLMQDVFKNARALHRDHISLPTLGWVLASVFAPQIRNAYFKQFPLLMLEGQPRKGKTTLIRTFLAGLLGLETEYSLQTSSAVIRRAVAGTNSIPVMIDEYEDSRKNYKSDEFNAILRSAYVAGQAQRMEKSKGGAEMEVGEFRLVAPVAVTSITGFEDEALADRAYNIRVSEFDRTTGRDALKWFREEVPNRQLLKWWLAQDPVWIASIGKLRDRVEASDRQQMCFAVVAAVLLYCAEKFHWDLDLNSVIDIWKINSDRSIVIDPTGALDIILAYIFQNGKLLKNDGWSNDGNVIKIHQGNVLDQILLNSKDMDVSFSVTRKWLLKTLEDAKSTKHVKETNFSASIGGKVKKCLVLDLDRFPLTQEVVTNHP